MLSTSIKNNKKKIKFKIIFYSYYSLLIVTISLFFKRLFLSYNYLPQVINKLILYKTD